MSCSSELLNQKEAVGIPEFAAGVWSEGSIAEILLSDCSFVNSLQLVSDVLGRFGSLEDWDLNLEFG